MSPRFLYGLGMCAVLGIPGIANADLITNGGFETGNFTGWTTIANSPMQIVTSPVQSGQFAAQIAGMTSAPDTLSQTITDSAGQNYALTFWLEIPITRTPSNSIDVYWDNVLVYSGTNQTLPSFTEITVPVLGTGSDTLSFVTGNDPGLTFVDSIGLATPEPDSLTLALLGTILLAGIAFPKWMPTVRHLFASRPQMTPT